MENNTQEDLAVGVMNPVGSNPAPGAFSSTQGSSKKSNSPASAKSSTSDYGCKNKATDHQPLNAAFKP
jgi:hypothetical protein